MASGIMINGTMQKVPFLAVSVGPYAALALLPMLAWLAVEYVWDVFEGSFYKRHLSNPVQSFSIGTWISALSITSVTLTAVLPSLRNVAIFLFILAILLILAFIILLVIWNYVRFWSYPSRVDEVKGVLLLECVAVQSIVVAGNKLYSHSLSTQASLFFIGLGILFYLAGFVVILASFRDKKAFSFIKNWSNTNAIIHGAVSITGLAVVSSSIRASDGAAVIRLIALFFCIFKIKKKVLFPVC
ncbi:hypothetical protein NLX67_15880 [Domibacillus sp. A3M-37]|uniref:SLAC1 family transporter n=1 Tax=Domibacillus sp. A3M-37 TaxID=2962037 RepID=UPI0020B6870D|nr:hypothetical protein [Domibacillus sp. A3M-37]MCP3763852.1 hypothetical protein [Domibacillus sp. A3M-37]